MVMLALIITDLKKELKQNNANFTVLKNTVFKIALQDTDQPVEIQDFDGATAVIYFDNDPTTPAKLLRDILKETKYYYELQNSKFGIKCG